MAIPNLTAILANTSLQIGGSKRESAIAKAWLQEHGELWDRVEINAPLGPGITLPPGTPAFTQKAAAYSSAPKADMVLYRAGAAAIVEVKWRIDASALGQVLTYVHILQNEHPDLLQVYRIITGQSIMPGLADLWTRYNVQVELFPYVNDPTPTSA